MIYGMVDLECLGDGIDAVICSIGVVRFDTEKDTVPHPTDKNFQGFYKNVSIQSCFDHGFSFGPGAIEFWLKQPKEAQNYLFIPMPEPITHVLDEFSNFVRGVDGIWSNPAMYDNAILVNYYTKLRKSLVAQPPAKKLYLDCRTLSHTMGRLPSVSQEKKHHGLYDAWRQAVQTHELLKCK